MSKKKATTKKAVKSKSKPSTLMSKLNKIQTTNDIAIDCREYIKLWKANKLSEASLKIKMLEKELIEYAKQYPAHKSYAYYLNGCVVPCKGSTKFVCNHPGIDLFVEYFKSQGLQVTVTYPNGIATSGIGNVNLTFSWNQQ